MSTDAAARDDARHPLAAQVQALRRLALAATRPAGPELHTAMVTEVAHALHARLAMVAVFADEQRTTMRTLAAVLDGQPLPGSVEYPLAQSPCVEVVGKGYCFMPGGVQARYGLDAMVADLGLDAYAAFPMNDRDGRPLGLVAVLDSVTIADGDADHAEAVLKIAAVRLAAELEREAASAALRRSEASYRAIFEAAEDCIFLHDWDSGRFLDANPKACASYGYSRDELLALTAADVSSGVPPYTAQDAARWMALAREGRCPPFEWQRRNRDGSLHWDEVRLKPVTIDGRALVLAVTRDITDRKAALQALLAREEQYRAIFDGSSDPIVLWNRKLEVVDVNAAFLRTTGFAHADIVGRHWTARPDADDIRKLMPLIESAIAGREARTVERVTRADGTLFDIELRYLPVAFGGEPHALGIGRDVTERLERERALERSEEQYRSIFNASADALILWDRQLRRVDVNPAFKRIFGWSRHHVVGQDLETCPDTGLGSDERRAMLLRALSGQAGSAEMELLHRDGRRIVADIRTVPFHYSNEPHVLLIVRDITAQRAAATERAELEAQLRQAQKMEAIGQLTGGIAHDFNNILTSVIGYLVLAQERADSLADPTLVRQLGAAQTAAQRARDLIAQMLAFARRQRGDRRPVALASVARQALHLLRSTLPASIELDDGALAGAQALPPVLGDAVQLEQALFNLCLNARDAMPRSGRIAVALSESAVAPTRCASCGHAVAAGRWLRLTVADTGTGIDPAIVSRIFEPFFTTKEVGRGSGMGLAMVHGIVHEHDGHIVVETEPGEGTRFHLLLPVAAGRADVPPTGVPTRANGRALAGRVMVVEDEPMVAAFMQELLAGWGLEVVLPADAPAALRWFDDPAHQVDLLLTDLTMPHLTGLDLAHHVSVLRPELPVVLYSGDPDAVDADAVRRAGVQAVLGKPVEPARLAALLQRWLGAR